MSRLFSRILSFRKRRGTSGVAYALLSGLIAVGVIGSLTVLGNNTGSVFGVAGDTVSNASSGGSGSGGGSSNAAPTISDIADASIAVDGTYGPTGFTISDAETAAGSLSVTGSSSNQTLVPNGNITLGGADGSRTITITPASGETGTSTITVMVDDGTDTSSDTFVLTVVPACSGSLSAGDACDLNGEEVVFVANYDPADGGGSRPFYVRHCDQGMSWNGSSCIGTRSLLSWNDGVFSVQSTPATSDYDGKANTDMLVTTDSSSAAGVQPHDAAVSCRSLGSDWFLPARYDHVAIYNNQNAGVLSGSFDAAGYWTSVSGGSSVARRILMTNGTLNNSNKHTQYAVRCARR